MWLRITARRSRAVLSLLGLWCALAGVVTAQDQAVSEYQVKAAYLYNFAKFVQWPPEAFASANSPIQFCVFNHSPFGLYLEQVVRGKTIAGRGVQISIAQTEEQIRSCHLLFVSSSQDRQFKQMVTAVRGTSVLTVGETKGFADQGGIIKFVLLDDRVQFEVNHKAATEARLVISSRLLLVAKNVTK